METNPYEKNIDFEKGFMECLQYSDATLSSEQPRTCSVVHIVGAFTEMNRQEYCDG